jgi:hypothetical protein
VLPFTAEFMQDCKCLVICVIHMQIVFADFINVVFFYII